MKYHMESELDVFRLNKGHNMIVYACFEFYFDGCNEYRILDRIFDSEEKAIIWKAEPFTSDPDRWREYMEFSVE